MIRLVACVVVAAAMAAAVIGCGGSSPEAGSPLVRYHDPSGGWTANVPGGWTSVGLGAEFVRGEPLADPTRLLVRTYRNHSQAAALRAFAVEQGITAAARAGDRAGDRLRWQRYRGRKAGRRSRSRSPWPRTARTPMSRRSSDVPASWSAWCGPL